MTATRLLLFGKQGAGKGTQAARLSKRLGIPHISTGDMFRAERQAGTALGQELDSYMKQGNLVPDELTLRLVKERLARPDAEGGFLFDGFPRTEAQAEGLRAVLGPAGLDALVELVVPTDVVVERIAGRRVCSNCQSVYHVSSMPPSGICTTCGSSDIVQRADDNEAAVRRRLDDYERQTAPLLDWYRRAGVPVRTIDGLGDPDLVFARILGAIDTSLGDD